MSKISRAVIQPFKSLYDYETYVFYIQNNVNFLKIDNVDIRNKYNFYVSCYHIKDSFEFLNLTQMGFYTPRNGGKSRRYLLDRGWKMDEISKVMSEKNKRERQSTKNYDEVKKKYGNCAKPVHYLTKINPLTGILYTSDEANQKVFDKQSKASRAKIKKYRNGEINVNAFSESFWINRGMTESEASLKIQELKNKVGHGSTLEGYIERYGIEKGKEKFIARQDKWQHTLKNKTNEEKRII